MLSQHEQERFEQVCLEHIWAAVGMHVICRASGSEADARSAATSVRDLVNVAPAYRACWERVKPIVLSQGFRSFISIVDSRIPQKDTPGLRLPEDASARAGEMRGAPQRGTHLRADERGQLAAERVLAIDTRERKERSSPPIESRADTVHQLASAASKTSTRDSRRALPRGRLRVLEGKFAGRELELNKALTKFGHHGNHQVAILRQKNGYSIVSITDAEPKDAPRVNGTPVGSRARILQDNDIVQIAGIKARFMRI
ncbi:MAG TPA: FHA domain-containing protein [Gammaproteobacteria bacterium]